MRKEIADLQEENEILKKGGNILRKEPEIKKSEFIKEHRFKFQVAKLCKVLEIFRIRFYARLKRPKSKRQLENEKLLEKISEI